MSTARRDVAPALVDPAAQPLTQREFVGLAIPEDGAYALGGSAPHDHTNARALGQEHMESGRKACHKVGMIMGRGGFQHFSAYATSTGGSHPPALKGRAKSYRRYPVQ